MLSLKERIELLENDIVADPPRISVYNDLPFAILRYLPEEEWTLRREVRLLATRLKATGKEVVNISLARLLWSAIENAEGIDAIIDLERRQGFVTFRRVLGPRLPGFWESEGREGDEK